MNSFALSATDSSLILFMFSAFLFSDAAEEIFLLFILIEFRASLNSLVDTNRKIDKKKLLRNCKRWYLNQMKIAHLWVLYFDSNSFFHNHNFIEENVNIIQIDLSTVDIIEFDSTKFLWIQWHKFQSSTENEKNYQNNSIFDSMNF